MSCHAYRAGEVTTNIVLNQCAMMIKQLFQPIFERPFRFLRSCFCLHKQASVCVLKVKEDTLFAIKYLIGFLPSKSSPGWTIPADSAQPIFQSLNLHGLSLDSFQVHIFLVLLSPELNTGRALNQCWVEENNHFSWLARNNFLMEPKTNANIYCWFIHLFIQQYSQLFFCQALFQPLVFQCCSSAWSCSSPGAEEELGTSLCWTPPNSWQPILWAVRVP